jgi:SAM-dependent methyltransferase
MKAQVRAALYGLGLKPALFRLAEWRRAKAHDAAGLGSQSGVSLPPAYLRMLVAGTPDADWFVRSGAQAAETLARAAEAAGRPLSEARTLLDFGCGAGRIARHMPAFTQATLYGVDYNPRLVAWCARHLSGVYVRNRLHPPLAFADGFFDAVYLFSVFTHLRRATQRAWLKELARITAPGGLVLLTFHDENHARVTADPALAALLARDGFAIAQDQLEGSNLLAAFQTAQLLRVDCAAYFTVHAVQSGAATGFHQALITLIRRG